ncbi:hypothetical protein NITMOv2_0777 [Nitrospira moscoviensis]|uniref:Uncharacterized protein n=1 Tax=Nitrospira moscoviensis TaxID=42253 RepID=A0A0K2G8C8_NITMO|nr:hypothetical protein NITMOv2_0777 [Nitrospira moscoviensis]
MLVGWLLYALDFHAFFLWQIVLVSGWLFVISKKQQKEFEAMLALAGNDAITVRFTASSVSKTRQYYAYSSFIYIVTYLWLINR